MTIRPLRLPALALALISLCAAPAAAVDREHQQLEADIRMLQEQSQQLQQMLAGLGDALKQLSARIDDQTALERKAFADAKAQIDNVAGDIRVIRERVDETNVRLGSLSQEMESLRTSLPQPGAAVALPSTSDALQPPGAGQEAAAAQPSAPCPGQTPQRMYDSAFSDYGLALYPLAIQGFETYIKCYPKSDQADDAQFQIGESYFNSNKFPEALAAYSRVISDFPGGNQVPNAYYKRGVTLENLKQPDQAKLSYQTAIEKFPEAQAAQLAKQRLDGLNRPAR
jgi:tol-pal system protein YbgF